MKINPLKMAATSKAGQNFYNKIAHPKYDNFLNNTLPIIESGVCTLSYVYATERDKKIPKEQKPALQWQNVLSGGIGMLISSALNKRVSNLGSRIIKGLKPEIMEDAHKVIDGIKVGLPICATSIVMRLILPVFLVPVSSWIEATRNKHNSKKHA